MNLALSHNLLLTILQLEINVLILLSLYISEKLDHSLEQHLLLGKKISVVSEEMIPTQVLWIDWIGFQNAAEELKRRALAGEKLGNLDKSIELLMQNTVLDSTDATARFNLGMLYWKKNDIFTAYDWWLSALRLTPEDKDLAYWMVRAEKRMEE